MIIIPFKTLKKLFLSNKDDGEVMGIIHSNDNIIYDRILFSHQEENGHEKCKINDIVVGKVSFHTHPKICYEIYKTNIGWPSRDDINAIITENNMKVLIVISIEGVYLIIKKKEVNSEMLKKISKEYKNNFDKKNIKIEEYIKQINELCNDCIKIIFFSESHLLNEDDRNTIKLEILK